MRPQAALLALAVTLAAAGARADEPVCGKTAAGFDAWLASFRLAAAEDGISPATLTTALAGVTYDDRVIALDRSQKPFKLSLRAFAAQRITTRRLREGRELLRRYQVVLEKIEEQFGVPAPVIVAIWGLETDYGEQIGDRPVFRSLATLAYDCRRAARFRGELMSALRIVERGDLRPGEMLGAWAGELGQTQFLPSSYERFAVDFDGDGRRNLRDSVPDVLASTALYLASNGWRYNGAWAPGTANFEVLATWNRSVVYQKTIAMFAERLVE